MGQVGGLCADERHRAALVKMKSYTEYLTFHTSKRREMVHITDQVEAVVKKSGVQDGLCFVSPMHITAAIYVNDLESGLIGRYRQVAGSSRPGKARLQTSSDGRKDNADAHLKALLLSPRDHAAGHRRPIGPGHMATGFLRGVRRPTVEARFIVEGARGVIALVCAWFGPSAGCSSLGVIPVPRSSTHRAYLRLQLNLSSAARAKSSHEPTPGYRCSLDGPHRAVGCNQSSRKLTCVASLMTGNPSGCRKLVLMMGIRVVAGSWEC